MPGATGVESSYLVQGLNASERKLFLTYFREESHSVGSYIFKENDEGDTLYVAESGVVSLRWWITLGGVEKTLLTAGKGGASVRSHLWTAGVVLPPHSWKRMPTSRCSAARISTSSTRRIPARV